MKLNCPRCGNIHPQCPPLITHVGNARIQIPMFPKPELKWAPDYGRTTNPTRHICDARNGEPK